MRGLLHTVFCPASLIHTIFHCVIFFFKAVFTFALIHTFLLDWLTVPYLRDWFVETFGEIAVCVCVWMCVFIHRSGLRRGPAMVHGVCSHVLCVTLFSLFPLGFLHLSHLTDSLQLVPQQCLRSSVCWIAKCYSQRRFRMISFDVTAVLFELVPRRESCGCRLLSVASFVSNLHIKVIAVVKPLNSAPGFS